MRFYRAHLSGIQNIEFTLESCEKNDFAGLIYDIFGNYNFDTKYLRVTFSDRIRQSRYLRRVKTVRSVANRLIRRYPLAKEDIERIVNDYPIQPDFDVQHSSRAIERMISPLAEVIEYHYREQKRGRRDYESYLRELRRMFEGVTMKDIDSRLAGEYWPRRNEIILYVNVICDMNNYGRTLEQAYKEVFMHELFHAYHHYTGSNARNGFYSEVESRNDYTANVVKESLASRFEWLYCDRNHIFNRISDCWNAFKVADYPYSGAKYIYGDAFFKEVFDRSLRDMDDSLMF